ncbi:MAG: hypothetical protein ACRDPC_25690 [Solirubrobacteraceae bacterium]
MHRNRNAGAEPAPRRANTPPPAGNVHGLGLVDALRIDLQPAQLPWLAAEIDIVRYCLEDELEHARARYDELPEAAKKERRPDARDAEEEVARRAYQLQALAMIRQQVPISGDAAAAAVAGPWADTADQASPEHERPGEPIPVAGPAALMTVLIGGAMRHAGETLGEALRGPALDVDHWTESSRGWAAGDVPRITPAIAEKLRALAAAVHALTDTHLHVLAHQAYSFDPEYDPVYADELEVAVGGRGTAPSAAGGAGARDGNS